jgi:predicted phosphodiesterase
MTLDSIAFISDIHANRWALEAVLADIEAAGIDRVINLGDAAYGPLDPVGTLDCLIERGIPSVRGNEDRILLENSPVAAASPVVAFVKEKLAERHWQWLKGLQPTIILDDGLFLCHATPLTDSRYLLYEVTPDGIREKPAGELEKELAAVDQDWVLCGHSHVPCEVRLATRTIIDVGSVGLQAYTDDVPYPHIMQTGDPAAHYVVMTGSAGSWVTCFRSVSYDRQAAARAAEANGYPDWAGRILTGRAEP